MERTPSLGLSQYERDDKGTWTGTVNADNRKIDREYARMRAELTALRIYVQNTLPPPPANPDFDGVLDEIQNNNDGTITIR